MSKQNLYGFNDIPVNRHKNITLQKVCGPGGKFAVIGLRERKSNNVVVWHTKNMTKDDCQHVIQILTRFLEEK